jgi:aromatic ring-opening dioxygenase catalytic subunit (LigB family)
MFFHGLEPATGMGSHGRFFEGLAGNAFRAATGHRAVVSAHWLEHTVSVTSGAKPALIYDYRGFPAHTYAVANQLKAFLT